MHERDETNGVREDAVGARRPADRDRSASAASAGAAAGSPIAGFVTGDARTRVILERARDFAESHLPVLIEGASGTGKELLAEGIHHWSGRRGAWVPVNAGALPAALLESELFGVRRGAFTGAAMDRAGLVEAAEAGTLFLDEVGELELSMQAKLLRFLEQHEVRRVGDTRVRRVDVRVVAATNRDLVERVRAGRFREDLYYRLCGAHVRVPSLDERPGDVPLLFHHFLDRYRRRYRVDVDVDRRLPAALLALPWPGNVRQLKNAIERAAVLATARGVPLTPSLFPAAGAPSPNTFADRVAAFERRLIVDALARTGWNRTRAASYLGGLKRTTLIGKMQRLGIVAPASET